MQRLHRPTAEARRAALHAVEQVAVAHQQADQPDQVVALPVAVHVGFGGADAAVRRQRAIEARVVDLQREQRIRRLRLAQLDAPEGIAEDEAAACE